ncbi:MAG: M24 family metallopeptidase, partial [Bacilli bacterium]
LEIDELPVLAEKFMYPLEEGMTIAVEPKFSFPGFGVVGTEDTYLITARGCERITITERGLIKM